MFNYCIKSDNPGYEKRHWCPTKLSKKTGEMYSETHWGWCSSKCPNTPAISKFTIITYLFVYFFAPNVTTDYIL